MRYNPERQEESDLTKITWICFFYVDLFIYVFLIK